MTATVVHINRHEGQSVIVAVDVHVDVLADGF